MIRGALEKVEDDHRGKLAKSSATAVPVPVFFCDDTMHDASDVLERDYNDVSLYMLKLV